MRLSDVCNEVFPRVLSLYPGLKKKKILCTVADLDYPNPGIMTKIPEKGLYIIAVDRRFAEEADEEEVEMVLLHELNEVRFSPLTRFISHPLAVLEEKRVFNGFSSYVRQRIAERAREGWTRLPDRMIAESIVSSLRWDLARR